MHPCLVPDLTSNFSVSPPPWITVHLQPLYWHTMILINFSSITWYLTSFHRMSISTLPNNFSKSIKLTYNGEFQSIDCSIVIVNVIIRSLQHLCCLKPAFFSLNLLFNASFILSNIILLSTLPAVTSREMPRWLLHISVVYFFFGTLTMYTAFHSSGPSCSFHTHISTISNMSLYCSNSQNYFY